MLDLIAKIIKTSLILIFSLLSFKIFIFKQLIDSIISGERINILSSFLAQSFKVLINNDAEEFNKSLLFPIINLFPFSKTIQWVLFF